jgi:hypothetical protein
MAGTSNHNHFRLLRLLNKETGKMQDINSSAFNPEPKVRTGRQTLELGTPIIFACFRSVVRRRAMSRRTIAGFSRCAAPGECAFCCS